MRLIKAILCLILLAFAVSATAQVASPNTTQGGANQMVTVLGGWGSNKVLKVPYRDTTPVWSNVNDSFRITIQPSTGDLYWNNGSWVKASTAEYFAGYGINFSNDSVLVDTAVIASKEYIDNALGTVDLQTVLTNGDSSSIGRIILSDYTNHDPISGVSKYSEFLTRKAHTSPTEPVVTMQINDRFIATDELMTVPIYSIKATPIFQITDSANSAMRYAGIVSDINVDSAHSEGYFKSAWMVQSGGHFGYPGARVQHYAGYVAHNPVVWDTCDNCYGIKIGGFNASNYKNATALAIGFVSANVGGHWSIYTSEHIGYNNYLGSGRTILGLAGSTEIDSNATLQTETITTTGLIKSTINISGSLTSLSYPQKVYVDSVVAAIPVIDTAAMLSAYLRKSGWTMSDAGVLVAPSTGVIKGTNGNLHINDNDTSASSRQGVWANLSGYYTNTSGVSRGFTVFGSSVSASGSARNLGYNYSATLNRTGTSSGIDAAFEAAPTLTNVVDFRGLHLNYNNANAWGIVQTGSLSPSYFAGELRLGTNSDAGTYQLQVTGPSYMNGALTLVQGSGQGINQAFAGATNNFEGSTSFTTGIISGNVFQNSTSKTNRFRGITTMDTTIELRYVPAYTTGGYAGVLVRNSTTDSVEYVTLSTVATTGSYADLSFPFTNTSAGTLNPAVNTTYNFTGTTSTWTLPVISGNTGKFIEVMNTGTGIITVNSNSGGNDIFDATAVNTYAVIAGAAITFFNNGTYWKTK